MGAQSRARQVARNAVKLSSRATSQTYKELQVRDNQPGGAMLSPIGSNECSPFASCTSVSSCSLGLRPPPAALGVLCARHRKRIQKRSRLAPYVARSDESSRVTIQLPLFNESTVADRGSSMRSRRWTTRAIARDPGARRLDRRDGRARPRATVERLRAEGSTRCTSTARPHRLQGRRARQRPRGRQGRARRHLRRRLHPAARLRPLDRRAHFADPKVGMVQTRWGHLNRDVSILTQDPGAHARRPPPRREPRALRRRLPLQLLGHRRHVAPRGHRRAPAAGSTTRSPRTSTSRTARSSRAGSSSTARTWSRPPSSRRTSRRSARSSTAGPRAPCRRRASCSAACCARPHARAARSRRSST
jgi:hypothetical protein